MLRGYLYTTFLGACTKYLVNMFFIRIAQFGVPKQCVNTLGKSRECPFPKPLGLSVQGVPQDLRLETNRI